MSEPAATAMAGPHVTVESFDGSGALAWREAMANIYAAVFAEPPYEEGPEQVAQCREVISKGGKGPCFVSSIKRVRAIPMC